MIKYSWGRRGVMTIRLKIHEHMGRLRLTQKDVSQQTGIRPSTISEYYHDTKKTISKEHMDKFCKLFKCLPGDLFEYVPDPDDDG